MDKQATTAPRGISTFLRGEAANGIKSYLRARPAAQKFIFGGVGGALSTAALLPIDTVSDVQKQWRNTKGEPALTEASKSFIATAKEIAHPKIRHGAEGGIVPFYAGAGGKLLKAIPATAISMGAIGLGEKLIKKSERHDMTRSDVIMAKIAALTGAMVGGGLAGVVGAPIGAGKDHRLAAAGGALAGSIVGSAGGTVGAVVGGALGGGVGYSLRKHQLMNQLGGEEYAKRYPQHLSATERVNIHKKASIKTAAELGATVGGVFGPIGAAIGGGKDHRARPFLGAVAGGMIGGLGGMALGPVASRIGATAGSIAGANLGYRSRKDALKAQLGEDKYKAMYPEHQKTLQDHVNGYKQ